MWGNLVDICNSIATGSEGLVARRDGLTLGSVTLGHVVSRERRTAAGNRSTAVPRAN